MKEKAYKPIQSGGSTSRVRLSPQIISGLGWGEFEDRFTCYALLRKPGEMLLAPVNLTSETGEHPFQGALDIIDSLQPIAIPDLGDIPSTRMLLASHRLSKFEACWTSSQKKQLDLKLGKELIQYLRSDNKQRVFPLCWGSILILLSEDVYFEALNSDFTGGELHIL